MKEVMEDQGKGSQMDCPAKSYYRRLLPESLNLHWTKPHYPAKKNKKLLICQLLM